MAKNDDIEEIDEIEEIEEVEDIETIEEIAEIEPVDEIEEIDEVVDELDEIDELDDVDDVDEDSASKAKGRRLGGLKNRLTGPPAASRQAGRRPLTTSAVANRRRDRTRAAGVDLRRHDQHRKR